MEVEIDLRGFADFDDRVRNATFRVRAELTQLIAHHSRMLKLHARRNAPSDTGHLKNSISRIQRGLVAMVYSDAEYARPIEFGAQSHPITPTDAGALNFFWEKIGQEVILGRVEHPGNDAHRFLTEAINRQWPQIVESAKRILNDVL